VEYRQAFLCHMYLPQSYVQSATGQLPKYFVLEWVRVAVRVSLIVGWPDVFWRGIPYTPNIGLVIDRNKITASGRDFVHLTLNIDTALPVLKARGCVFGAFCDDFVAPNELASNRSVACSLIRYSGVPRTIPQGGYRFLASLPWGV